MLRMIKLTRFRHREKRVRDDDVSQLSHLVRHGNLAAAKARAQLVVVRADRDKLQRVPVRALRVHGARSQVIGRHGELREAAENREAPCGASSFF